MRYLNPALYATMTLLASAAWGQTPPAGQGQGLGGGMGIQGKVQSLNGSTLTLSANDGKTTTFTLPANVEVQVPTTKTMADIKEGEVVGSAADLGPDGKLHAEEVHFIPDAVAQGRVGHRQMGDDVNRSMTNATVKKVVRDAQGLTMTLQYPGGQQEIAVANGTPITGRVAGNVGMLKPGVEVTLMTAKDESGNAVVRAVRIGGASATR